jgi:pimeloyl-ACP methyl ester carboxylesterase
MRFIAIAALLILHGCAFTQLREDLDEFYANPAVLARRVAPVEAPVVTRLDEPGFLESLGRKGLWQPVSFAKERRSGVYFLEPYDATKLPVLFVHGAGGTPQDWRYFIEHLDRSKFQPWVYYYPTGLPIEISASWLDDFVSALHARYGFRSLIVVGHSMGGLVARRFIDLNRGGYVTGLVSLATPWAGVPFARLGAGLGPYAIPSWRDLVPESAFLRSLDAGPLAPSVEHHVFYGYREAGGLFDSDGVVSVASQVHAPAAQVHGFRTDHSAILDDAAVFGRFAHVLAGFN